MNILNAIFNRFGGQQNFQNQLNSYSQQCQQQGVDPEQNVKQLLNSGRMTQATFNYYAKIADMATGRNK